MNSVLESLSMNYHYYYKISKGLLMQNQNLNNHIPNTAESIC